MSFDTAPKNGGADATNRLPEGDGHDGPPWPDQTVDVLRQMLTEPAGTQLPDWYHRKYQWTAFPEAARLSRFTIVHFMSGTIFRYYEGRPATGNKEATNSRVFIKPWKVKGDHDNGDVVTGPAADDLWAGLCILAADWRELAKEVPSESVQLE